MNNPIIERLDFIDFAKKNEEFDIELLDEKKIWSYKSLW